jgi:hypothetical protein
VLDHHRIGLVAEHGLDRVAGRAQDDESERHHQPHRQQRAAELDEYEAAKHASRLRASGGEDALAHASSRQP